MASRQQKFAKNGSERNLIVGTNHIFEVGLRTFPWSRKYLSVVLKQLQKNVGFLRN